MVDQFDAADSGAESPLWLAADFGAACTLDGAIVLAPVFDLAPAEAQMASELRRDGLCLLSPGGVLHAIVVGFLSWFEAEFVRRLFPDVSMPYCLRSGHGTRAYFVENALSGNLPALEFEFADAGRFGKRELTRILRAAVRGNHAHILESAHLWYGTYIWRQRTFPGLLSAALQGECVDCMRVLAHLCCPSELLHQAFASGRRASVRFCIEELGAPISRRTLALARRLRRAPWLRCSDLLAAPL